MYLLLALMACASTPEPAVHGAHSEGPPHDGVHAAEPHAAGDHATVSHRFDDPDRWSKVFDDPQRDAWQKPAELIAALEIPAGAVVADIGAGTGYFNPHLAAAVGADGAVIAVDIEASLVEHMAARAQQEGTPQVQARLGRPDDPALSSGEVDLVLLVDTYHHIDGRVAYFGRLLDAVKVGGRLVVVDFKPGDIPIGPPESHRIPLDKVQAELTEAGWVADSTLDLLPYQFVVVMVRPE